MAFLAMVLTLEKIVNIERLVVFFSFFLSFLLRCRFSMVKVFFHYETMSREGFFFGADWFRWNDETSCVRREEENFLSLFPFESRPNPRTR
jgi:hypothetical protein